MRFGAQLSVPKFKAQDYTKALRNKIEILTRYAAREYLRAAIEKIPVDTGMARGSFLNLGKFLRVSVPISPKRTAYKNGNPILYYHTPGSAPEVKSPNLAKRYSTSDPAKMFFWNKTGTSFTFQYNIRVTHFNLLDEIGVGLKQPPWHASQAGREAFRAYWLANWKKLPKVKTFCVKTTIGMGTGFTPYTRIEPLKTKDTL